MFELSYNPEPERNAVVVAGHGEGGSTPVHMVTNNAGNVTRITIVKISAGTLERKAPQELGR